MKNRLPGRKRYGFCENRQRESTKELNNPLCGWYQIHTFRVEEEPDLEELRWCVEEKDRLALVIFHIGAYRSRSMDAPALSHMEAVLRFFQERKTDLILRVVYDNEGKGMEQEPGLFSRVLTHVEQIGGLLGRYQEQIYIFQGLFVGSWGEMHSSRYLSADKLIQIMEKLRSCLGKNVYLAVRRPVFYRMFFSSVEESRRMGLFDDGMFGSATHLGTFGADSKNRVGWEQAWNRKEELCFEEELGQYAPIGGEAVLGENRQYPYHLEETTALLKQMHISYLNRVHDRQVLDIWKKMTWEKKDAWKGCNGYDYIGAHLGYRFRVRETKVKFQKGCDDRSYADITVRIQNDGFSCCYEEAEVYLETENDVRGAHVIRDRILLPSDVRKWQSGTVSEVCGRIPLLEEALSLYLCMQRKRDGQAIRFANDTPEERRVLLGRIVI